MKTDYITKFGIDVDHAIDCTNDELEQVMNDPNCYLLIERFKKLFSFNTYGSGAYLYDLSIMCDWLTTISYPTDFYQLKVFLDMIDRLILHTLDDGQLHLVQVRTIDRKFKLEDEVLKGCDFDYTFLIDNQDVDNENISQLLLGKLKKDFFECSSAEIPKFGIKYTYISYNQLLQILDIGITYFEKKKQEVDQFCIDNKISYQNLMQDSVLYRKWYKETSLPINPDLNLFFTNCIERFYDSQTFQLIK